MMTLVLKTSRQSIIYPVYNFALNKLQNNSKKHKQNTLKKSPFGLFLNGGGGGIRTHGTLARTTVFKTAPINRSGTPPSNCFGCIYILPIQNLLSSYFL